MTKENTLKSNKIKTGLKGLLLITLFLPAFIFTTNIFKNPQTPGALPLPEQYLTTEASLNSNTPQNIKIEGKTEDWEDTNSKIEITLDPPPPPPVTQHNRQNRPVTRNTQRQAPVVSPTPKNNPAPPSVDSSEVLTIAAEYVGVPYKGGGTNPETGLDCSGFTQLVYSRVGISLPRTSVGQKNAGTIVSAADALPGDLIWTPGHVAIYAGGDEQIDAPRPGKTIQFRKIWQKNPTFIRLS